MKTDVNFNGTLGSLEIERGSTKAVLQLQQVNVRPERHLPEAVRMKVELVLKDLGEVLQSQNLKPSMKFLPTELLVNNERSID